MIINLCTFFGTPGTHVTNYNFLLTGMIFCELIKYFKILKAG